MSVLTKVTNSMFKGDPLWEEVTDDDKEKSVFMINRYMSRLRPELVADVNMKGTDGIAVMDLWQSYFKGKGHPYNFWARTVYKSQNKGDKDFAQRIGLDKIDDVDYIRRWYPEEYNELSSEIEKKNKKK